MDSHKVFSQALLANTAPVDDDSEKHCKGRPFGAIEGQH